MHTPSSKVLPNPFQSYWCFFTDPSQDQRGNLGVPMDISSPITSDEEYLSPLEEGMDFSFYRGPEPRKIVDTRFKEPPAFQVSENETEMLKYNIMSELTFTCTARTHFM